MKNQQASHLPKGEGRKIRRARNYVRRYAAATDAKCVRRYERARACLVYHGLLES